MPSSKGGVMVGKDMITMSQKELRRLHFVRNAIGKVVKQIEAAKAIGVCARQMRRMIKRVREEGDRGLIHRSRGRRSNCAIQSSIKEKALALFRAQYPDFGPTLASEKLLERDKIEISDETLRLWLNEADIPYRQRKKRPHRQWRERKEHVGAMVQMDGSHHDWFEGRGPRCVLMGYIDDATGKVYARFDDYEGTKPALKSFKGYIKRNGIPASVYLDKHTTYRSPGRETIAEELEGKRALSQFERAAGELGVKVIHANSPQAKGRVERLFGTFQDRVIKEMRLANISGIEEGNRFLDWYLPIYNKRFGVLPLKEEDIHRPVPAGLDLDRILCIKTERVLRNDFTVSYECKLYQVLDNVRGKKIVVEDRVDGKIVLRCGNLKLRCKPILLRPKKVVEQPKRVRKGVCWKVRIPAQDHPWKRPLFVPRARRTQSRLTVAT